MIPSPPQLPPGLSPISTQINLHGGLHCFTWRSIPGSRDRQAREELLALERKFRRKALLWIADAPRVSPPPVITHASQSGPRLNACQNPPCHGNIINVNSVGRKRRKNHRQPRRQRKPKLLRLPSHSTSPHTVVTRLNHARHTPQRRPTFLCYQSLQGLVAFKPAFQTQYEG